MVYSANNMMLEVVATLFSGKANDVVVCRDRNSPIGAQYTLIIIRDRDCIKTLLSILEASNSKSPHLFNFAQNDELIYGFPYQQERRFSSFARGQMQTPVLGETICTSLVMECIASALPSPLLYLALTQDNVNITTDNSIFFTPIFDLSRLDPNISETECTVYCAKLILELLEGGTKKKLKSCELIRKKCRSNSYSSFPELYRDIKLTAMPGKKQGIKARIKGVWLRSKDNLFRLLLGLCIVAVVIALVMLISQIIFGDIPLLRLFKNCFEFIGTEHLK